MGPEDVARQAMLTAVETMKAHPHAISFCEEHGCGPIETEREEHLAARNELRRLSYLFQAVYEETFKSFNGVDMRGEMLAGPMTLRTLHGGSAVRRSA